LHSPFSTTVGFNRIFQCPLFQLRNQHEKEFFFFQHSPYVDFHVILKEIKWDYVGAEAKQHGKLWRNNDFLLIQVSNALLIAFLAICFFGMGMRACKHPEC
jgi:hypothetical protein